MDKFPSEVLHKIFIQLSLQKRLECLLVCHNWWKVLDSCSLFHSVMIRSHDLFSRYMDEFKRLPQLTSNVEELRLQNLMNAKISERNLFDIFPNVCMISMSSNTDDFMKHDGILYSKSELEYLFDLNECILTTQIINLKLGDRLETLKLFFSSAQNSSLNFSHLQDLPVLKKLYLYQHNIKILNLESIHNNIPTIQDFFVIGPNLLASSMPSNIISATFIKSLQFTPFCYADTETCAQMYQYMTNKYTNCVPDNVDPFKTLDDGNSQIKDLRHIQCVTQTIFHYLCQSMQSEYIEKLTVGDTIFDVIRPLKSMTNLSSLSIIYIELKYKHICLTDLLDACPPALKSLNIGECIISATPFTKQLESIEHLILGYVAINSNIGDIISNCFPNLTDLNLDGGVRNNVHIVLRSPISEQLKYC